MRGFIWFPTCRLIDLVGFNVAMASEAQFVSSMSDRSYKSMLIPLMQQDKRLGIVPNFEVLGVLQMIV